MNLFPQILTQIAGGVAASYLDNTRPQWTQHVGAVPISPGMISALGVVAALAFRLPLPGKQVFANMAGGALVYEGVKIGESQVLPRLQALLPGTAAAGVLPGYGSVYGPGVTQFELQQALHSYRAAA